MKMMMYKGLRTMKYRPKLAPALLAALLFFLVFALFAPSLRYGLMDLDDHAYLSDNPLFTEGLSASAVRSVFTSTQLGMYTPLLYFSYGLDAALLNASSTAPWGFHFTNVLLHALNSVLLFLLLLNFCKKPWRAFFFAAIWALHPLRVESIAWVSERKDVLSGFFSLLCIGAYVGAWTRRAIGVHSSRLSIPWTIASLLFFAFALMAKSSVAPIPFGLLLLDLWPLRRMEPAALAVLRAAPRLLAEKIPFILLAALASLGTTCAYKEMDALIDAPLSVRLVTIPIHYAFYLAKYFLPRNLAPLYPDITPSVLICCFSVLLLSALTAGAWLSRRRQPQILVGWFLFLGLLVPTIGLVRFGAQSIGDRYTYLPAVGLSIALLHFWPSDPGPRPARRMLRPFVAMSILALLACATLRLLPAWQSTPSLFNHILSIFPDNPSALGMRSSHLIRTAGDFQTASEGFDRIIRSDSYTQQYLVGKAHCLAELQGSAEAKAFLLQASALGNPHIMHALVWDLARYSLGLGQYDDAIRHAQRALQLPFQPPADNPDSIAYLHLLAMAAAYENGDFPLALAHARQFPAYADKASLELADLLPYYLHQWMAFHRADAYAFFRRLAQAYPDRTGLLNNLAWGLATADWSPAPPTEVLALAQQVCAALPQPNPGALDTLAAAQANAGDFPAAIRTLQQAIHLLPDAEEPRVVRFRELLLARLALYHQRQPYREEAFSRLMAAEFGLGLHLTQKGPQP